MDNNPISKINPIVTRLYLEDKKENQYFERKGLGEKDTKPTKIAEELIGMLNADGGILAFGISDSGEIQNLRTIKEKLGTYRSLVFDFIQPTPNIQLEEIEIDGKLIFLYHVEQNLERIFYRNDNENVYLRTDHENRKLSREQVKKLEYDKQLRKFEDEIESEFDFEDLDLNLLEVYRKKINYKGDLKDLLVKKYVAQKKENIYKIKKSGILLFSKDPEKYIPSASIRYIRYDGLESKTGVEHNVIKDERLDNNIPNLIDELRIFLRASFKDYYFLDLDSGKFRKVPEYPEEAWLEAIVNALCHRSYNIQGNSVYIKHFDNRLEISNSGPLPAQVTIENIKTERFARNPRVTRVLEDMGYVRQLNEGVSRIYESMEKSMLSTPEYIVINDNVVLTLRNKVGFHSKTVKEEIFDIISDNQRSYNKTQMKILVYLFNIKNEGTLKEISDFTEIKENTIRTYLNSFIKEGIIEKIGKKERDKNAIYRFQK